MARPAIFALIAVIGLPLGYHLRAALDQPTDRAAAMVSLFETHCLPTLTGQPPPPLDTLVRLSGNDGWADQDSKLWLTRSDHSCQISDALRQFNAAEQAAVDAAIPALITTRFPHLQPRRHDLQGWDRLDIWEQFPDDPRSGMTIHLTRFLKTGPDGQTTLRLSLPRSLTPPNG